MSFVISHINCHYGAWYHLLLVLYQLSLWSLVSFLMAELDVICHQGSWCALLLLNMVSFVATDLGIIYH